MIFENVRFLNESINEKIANYLFNKSLANYFILCYI